MGSELDAYRLYWLTARHPAGVPIKDCLWRIPDSEANLGTIGWRLPGDSEVDRLHSSTCAYTEVNSICQARQAIADLETLLVTFSAVIETDQVVIQASTTDDRCVVRAVPGASLLWMNPATSRRCTSFRPRWVLELDSTRGVIGAPESRP